MIICQVTTVCTVEPLHSTSLIEEILPHALLHPPSFFTLQLKALKAQELSSQHKKNENLELIHLSFWEVLP